MCFSYTSTNQPGHPVRAAPHPAGPRLREIPPTELPPQPMYLRRLPRGSLTLGAQAILGREGRALRQAVARISHRSVGVATGVGAGAAGGINTPRLRRRVRQRPRQHRHGKGAGRRRAQARWGFDFDIGFSLDLDLDWRTECSSM